MSEEIDKPQEERLEGQISAWETERGFGWIKYEGGSIFTHIKEFEKGFVPKVGDGLSFVIGSDPKGRPCAKEIDCDRKNRLPSLKSCLSLMVLLALPLAASTQLPIAPWKIPLAMLPVSIAAWILFRYDKKRAYAGRWRVSETELHGLELFGGWPGAFLAQQKYRHKTRKTSYQAIFWSIVFLHQLVALDIVLGHWMWREATSFWVEWIIPTSL